MKPIKVKAGQKLKIKVPIKGAPPPEIFWAKGGMVLKPKPKRRAPNKEEEAEMIKLKGIPKSKWTIYFIEHRHGNSNDGIHTVCNKHWSFHRKKLKFYIKTNLYERIMSYLVEKKWSLLFYVDDNLKLFLHKTRKQK